MDIFMLLAVLPEVTGLFFPPGKLGMVPGSITDSSHPICILPYLPLELISSPVCTDFAWKDVGSNLASFETIGYFPTAKTLLLTGLHRAMEQQHALRGQATQSPWGHTGRAIAVPCMAPRDTSVHHPWGRPELRQHLCCVKK